MRPFIASDQALLRDTTDGDVGASSRTDRKLLYPGRHTSTG